MMRESVSDKKERIKQSAIAMFAQKGNITIRDIAKETGVNVASINYYFGGKENLLAEIELAMVNKLHTLFGDIEQKKLDARQTGEYFIEKAYVFIQENPGFFKFIGGTLVDQNVPYTLKYINQEMLDGPLKKFIFSLIKEGSGLKDKTEIENRCMIFFASLALPVFQPQFSEKGTFIAYFLEVIEKDNFTSYMNSLMNMLMRP
jgi:TetR/AcrR family transcriptional regulator, regulator of cefoperazone and chloramphenicol sensitivity